MIGFIIGFAAILLIAYLLDESIRRAKEMKMAEEFAKQGYKKEYKIEQHFHAGNDLNLQETYDIKGAKVIDAEVIKNEVNKNVQQKENLR